MNKKGLILACVAASCVVATLGFVSINNQSSILRAEEPYACADIEFGHTHNSNGYSGSGTPNPTTTTIEKELFSVVIGANAQHSSTYTDYPLKIGGSKSGKYAGNITINFTGTCDKVMIYAAGWVGDSAACLTIDEDEQSVATTAKGVTEPSYQCYTFEFDKTNTITIGNGSPSGSNRVLISKMVFRVY